MDYETAKKEIKKSVSDSSDVLQNIVNYLCDTFDHYNWVGIYLVKGDNLFLGPWVGPEATEHTKIPIGQGVCGSAAETGSTEIVDDVNQDNRYLACFVNTKSEIVVPIYKNEIVVGEIDIDSDKIGAFTKEDKIFLEKVAEMISPYC